MKGETKARSRYSHTVNPRTGREILVYGDRFFKLLEHGYKYDEELNRLYEEPLPPDTAVYIPEPRMLSPKNRSMKIGGTTYNELMRDRYRYRGGKWVKLTEEELEAEPIPSTYYSPRREVIEELFKELDKYDYDEFEYDADGLPILPF